MIFPRLFGLIMSLFLSFASLPAVKSIIKNDDWLKYSIRKAKEFNMCYPIRKNHKIIGIGNTPSYFITTAQKLDDQKHNKKFSEKYQVLPFSGKWFTKTDDNLFIKDDGILCPTDESLDCYWNFLSSMDFNPRDVIRNFHTYNKKTILVDSVISGNGLASFLSVLMLWAKKDECNVQDLVNSIEICALRADKNFYSDAMTIVLPNDNTQYQYKVNNFPINKKLLAAWDDGLKLNPNDRLVPEYRHTSWGNINIKDYEISDNVRDLFNLIDKAIGKKNNTEIKNESKNINN